MNERIKALAVEADFALYEDGNFRSDPGQWINEELEKFAKLIVRECCLFVYDEAEANIKKHFGVQDER
jgi:hypothetical protein